MKGCNINNNYKLTIAHWLVFTIYILLILNNQLHIVKTKF